MFKDILIELKNVRTYFYTALGIVRAVDGVDFIIHRNRIVGLVGESGCGKSVMSLTIMGLVPKPIARVSGKIFFNREDGSVIDLAKLDPRGKKMRRIRGKEISMIFQEPMTSLNPVYTIGRQIMETIQLHQKTSKNEARQRATDMLDVVGIPAPVRRVDEYPHQMSGGMRQRAMIAMALACNPTLLIADEPTTALDVTIQAQILELMQKLQRDFKTSILIITHSLGVVAGVVDEVAVMYLGQFMEYGSVLTVFKKRYHPYTQGLLKSIPIIGNQGKNRLNPIEGVVPDLNNIPSGCRFADRCSYRKDKCDQPPPMFEPEPLHQVRCWLYDPLTK